ncbi:hypothetical protein FCE95_13935 [Luteimonas gilva]|uniref:Uncharacterized protein n=1 Tax=Luteimonas gilva TaxID=2572684 RepID=A0A4U5JL74_9GAMM|nr:hypothetical protein [Luteimonas gilva]TKR29261.1 hypothetical protein FCE95_13935 [Luteimonas gilva]
MRHRLAVLLCTAMVCALCACKPQSGTEPAASAGATKPAEAVRLLTQHLHDDDLQAFARDAAPPELQPKLEQAWREGRTRWPLDELPFDERLPQLLSALSAPGSEKKLQQVFDRQFSGAHAELKAAAMSLGLFGVQYVRSEGDYSEDERQHYAQFVQAISQWGLDAPLGDPQRARRAIPQLTRAARSTGLSAEADFRRLGMQESLRRLGPFMATVKQSLATYGLRLDESLSGLQASLQQQTGDRARVRLRYTLGGTDIDTVVGVERHGGRWYISDYLRHAEAAAGVPAGAETPPKKTAEPVPKPTSP